MGGDFQTEFFEKQVHALGVALRHEVIEARPRGGADRAIQIQPFVLSLLDPGRAGAGVRPEVGQGTLLAEAALVREPDLELLAGVVEVDLDEFQVDVQPFFLKKAWAAKSALRCRGRGLI